MNKRLRGKFKRISRPYLGDKNPTTWSDPKSMEYHLGQWEVQKQSTLGFVNFASSHLSSSKLVLDVGCGLGAPTYWMAKNFLPTQFIGLDSDVNLIAGANRIKESKKISNLDFQFADVNKLPRKHSIDGVVSFQTLLCLPSVESHLTSIFQKINPKWVGILSLFYEGDISCNVEVLEHIRQRKSFYNIYSIPYIERIALKNGYKIAKVEKFCIDIDLTKPEDINYMGTYTEKISTALGPERIQISGPLIMSWYFVMIEKE